MLFIHKQVSTFCLYTSDHHKYYPKATVHLRQIYQKKIQTDWFILKYRIFSKNGNVKNENFIHKTMLSESLANKLRVENIGATLKLIIISLA